MTTQQGKFVWYDVMTSDSKAAESFYRSVIGWDAKDSGMPNGAYTLLSVGSTMVGGLMPIPPDAGAHGAKPCWSGYIGVDDVDATAARVTAAGGAIHKAPQDIPGVGRFAVAADPHGARFVLFHANGGPQTPPPPPNAPGLVGWHELHAGDRESDFAFYSSLFGWTKAEAVDMGAMGIYQTFATGGAPIGGMMTKTPATAAPYWLYYFNVEDIDAARGRASKAGGQILFGPQQVPGGSFILHCLDPQGAMFAMVGPKL
jgi:predicted enzyme related to lactoylglutathione lyase